MERDPVQDRLPEPALVRPGGRKGGLRPASSPFFSARSAKRARGQEQAARPLGERRPAVAAKRALPACPVRRRKGACALGRPRSRSGRARPAGRSGSTRARFPRRISHSDRRGARSPPPGASGSTGDGSPTLASDTALGDPDPRVDVAAAERARVRWACRVARSHRLVARGAEQLARARLGERARGAPPRRSRSIARM